MQFQHLVALDIWKFHFRIYLSKGAGGQWQHWKAPCKSGGSHAFTAMFVSSNLPLGFTPMPWTAFVGGKIVEVFTSAQVQSPICGPGWAFLRISVNYPGDRTYLFRTADGQSRKTTFSTVRVVLVSTRRCFVVLSYIYIFKQ